MKLRLLSLLAISSLGLACSVAGPSTEGTTNDGNEIVNVPQTDVERQAIGNCWLYAHASWVESMHKAATSEDFDTSQSYWTYWHWFDQLAGGFSDQVSTGGNWSTANRIIKKYGIMAEADFISADTTNEMSARQSAALATINESLKTGALKDSDARRDKKILRAEMDRAWGLTPEMTAMLDQVFGESAARTFSSSSQRADATGTKIMRGEDFAVAYPSGPGQAPAQKTLANAMSEWREAYYWGGEQRAFFNRVQTALHDAQPVVITWFVDFNAMESREGDLRGSFNMKTYADFGPGRQGGHMTVLEDYQAKLADGRVLKAGETLDPQNPEHASLLAAALEPSTEIQFLRIKNSWGAARLDRPSSPGMPGYHDLYVDYLNGPVKRCAEVNGQTDTTNCPSETTPLQNVVLPPGY